MNPRRRRHQRIRRTLREHARTLSRLAARDCGEAPPLSPEARAALVDGLRSAREQIASGEPLKAWDFRRRPGRFS